MYVSVCLFVCCETPFLGHVIDVSIEMKLNKLNRIDNKKYPEKIPNCY